MKRTRATATLLALGLALLAAPASALTNDGGARALAARKALDAQVLARVNEARAEHGLYPLRLSVRLSAAASLHTREMAENGFFAHESAGGGSFWQRIERFYGSSGYRSWSVGENLLWASPDASAGEVVRLWLGSPRHRLILLDPEWREIGVAAVHASSAPGAFKRREVTIVTADFGVRSR